MSSLNYITLWLSVIILIIGSQNVVSQQTVTVKMTNQYTTRVCAEAKNKEVLITVGLGAVSKNDSLYAYDMLIKYDPSIIKIEGPVYQNTLAEFTKYRDVNIGFEPDKIRAFAFSEVPFAGNRELIGFFGRLLTDCADPVKFEIIDFEIAEDYKKNLMIDSVLIVTPKREVSIENKVEISLDKSELIFDSTETQKLVTSVKINPYTDLENMFFDINLENSDNFVIKKVSAISEKVSVNQFEKVSNQKYVLNLNVFDSIIDETLFEVEFVSNNKTDEDIISQIIIAPRNFDNCHCYSEYIGKQTQLIAKAMKDTVIGSVENISNNISINYMSNNIYINNPSKYEIHNYVIFDINGFLIQKGSLKYSQEMIEINDKISNGLYLIRLIGNKIDINKSIVIYN